MAVTIWVSLDTGENPPVGLDDRSKVASSGETIKWKKKDDNGDEYDFEISSLVPAGEDTAFLNPEMNKRRSKLECEFNPDLPDTEYPYTLTVTFDDGGVLKQYDTTETVKSSSKVAFSTTGGRPVIRN